MDVSNARGRAKSLFRAPPFQQFLNNIKKELVVHGESFLNYFSPVYLIRISSFLYRKPLAPLRALSGEGGRLLVANIINK